MTRIGLGSMFLATLTMLFGFVACGTDAPADSAMTSEADGGPSPTTTASAQPSGVVPGVDASQPVHDAAADAANPDVGKPGACPSTATLAPGDSSQKIMVGGVERTYFVHVPASYTGKMPVPLLFDFHPLSVNSATWKLATGWTGVGDKNGFIVVTPQGIDDRWNVGRCCGQTDDVGFVRAMITKMKADACIDAKRVYASGCSNGGGMSYRLACEAADVIAAVAPVDFDCLTGPTNSPSCGGCNPGRPITVAQFRTKSDDSCPYDGGPTSVVQGIEFPGAKANFADWGNRNTCNGAPVTNPTNPLCDTYQSCGAGTQTTLCSLPVGIHCANYIPFDIADVAWGFIGNAKMP